MKLLSIPRDDLHELQQKYDRLKALAGKVIDKASRIERDVLPDGLKNRIMDMALFLNDQE